MQCYTAASASSCVAGHSALASFCELESWMVILVRSFCVAADLKPGENRSVSLDQQFLISNDTRCFQHFITPG